VKKKNFGRTKKKVKKKYNNRNYHKNNNNAVNNDIIFIKMFHSIHQWIKTSAL
jgi:hypothetical protein